MSTPAPPEPKPGDIWFKGYRSSADQRNLATRLRIALEDRTDGFVFRRATVEEIVTELERLQARVVELERVIAAKDEELKRIIRTSTNTNTAELAEDALNLKAAP